MTLQPPQIIKKAVSGMLPKNKLRDRRLERLKIYLDDHHPHEQNILKVYDAPRAFKQQQQQQQNASSGNQA